MDGVPGAANGVLAAKVTARPCQKAAMIAWAASMSIVALAELRWPDSSIVVVSAMNPFI